ncbi:MAG TPA: helix-turn-helix transcriptional regulator [Gemmatimonadaceae bacterium]|nr:helix-turn-helix transcriptional regulator [Gemmatimonadaceae bacterium]
MTLSTMAEQQAFQSVKRACYAGLDSVTLRVEVARRVARVVPSDENYFWTLDPETGLVSHGIAQNPSTRLLADFVGHHYPDDEATQVIDQARAGAVIKRGTDPAMEAMLAREGLHQDMRALFFTPEAYWGSWCILRGQSPAFTDREARFLERIAPHVSAGLKSAALLELAAREPDVEEVAEPAGVVSAVPAVLVLGPRGDVALRTAAADRYLDDLGAAGAAGEGRLPFAVLSVRGRLLRLTPHAGDGATDARLRARGRSGTWYVLRATLSEPDASGLTSVVVSIEPAARREVAPLLFRLYGLSPREREVLLWVVRGEPTKWIAGHLGLSVHTVQDYLDKACEKVGVRGRKALVAKLFQDGFAPGLCA